MKQIGIGLHNFHDRMGRLPTSEFHDNGSNPVRWNWIPKMLRSPKAQEHPIKVVSLVDAL